MATYENAEGDICQDFMHDQQIVVTEKKLFWNSEWS